MGFLLEKDYKYAFIAACILHFILLFFLGLERQTEHPVLELSKNHGTDVQHDSIKAVSVARADVEKTLQKLKQEKLEAQRAEIKRQQKLEQEAKLAVERRLAEQRKIAQLKAEAHKMELLQKQKLQEQAEKLKQLALQKQAEETKLLAAKKAAEKLKSEVKKAALAKPAPQEVAKTAIAQDSVADESENNNAAMAGEINKYKAFEIAKDLSCKFKNTSIKSLDIFPQSKYKEMLISILNHSIERIF